MKIISRRTPSYTLPPTTKDSNIFGNPGYHPLLSTVREPTTLNCLIVDDTDFVLKMNYTTLNRILGSISSATTTPSDPSASPLLSFQAYIPNTRRADFDSLDEQKLQLLVEIYNSSVPNARLSVATLSSHLENLRTKDRPYGALDGLEAFIICAVAKIDFVVSDLSMIGANGLQFIQATNGLTSAYDEGRLDAFPHYIVPETVIVSGGHNTLTSVDLLKAGAAAFVDKPYTSVDLGRAINYTLFGVLGDNSEAFEVRSD